MHYKQSSENMCECCSFNEKILNPKSIMLDFCEPASEVPDIIMHQLKSIYNGAFKDSDSHPIHTCFAMIASNRKGEDEGGKRRDLVSHTSKQTLLFYCIIC